MKASKLVFLLTTLFFSQVRAQWTQLSSGTIETLNDIHMVTVNTGYSVGNFGVMVKTTDAGATWNDVTIPSTQTLRSVFFLDEDHGFVCGEDGLFETLDGGQNWSQIPLSGDSSMHHIEFLDAGVGFCTGLDYTIYKTVDGGVTWVQKPVNTTDTYNPVSDISFPTPLIGYAVCTAYNWSYLKTTDGGETWEQDSIGPMVNLSNLEAVHFNTVSDGFLGGWYISAFVRTLDSGSSWTEEAQLSSVHVYGIDFFNGTDGVTACGDGWLYETHDAGTTWTPVNVYASFQIWLDVDFDPAGMAYAVGGDGQIYKNETITSTKALKTTDISVWPNPTNDFINLTSNELINQVEILDLSGRLVQVENDIRLAQTRINLPRQSGVYLVRLLLQSKAVETLRVVKR